MHASFETAAYERVKDYKELQQAGLVCLDGDFLPAVHYPPITMYPPITQEAMFAGYQLPQDGKLDVYAHLPFCKRRCIFCHYPVKLGEQREEKDHYLTMMEKEMDIYMGVLGIDKIRARSILVGGGTPTYLSPVQLERFLRFFTARIDLTQCTQFNYDLDPQTMLGPEGKERLSLMQSYGVDRLTIGIQSLNDTILKKMNRHHSVEEAIESIHVAQEMGFQLNIEFIFGFPGQTIDAWVEDMQKAVSLGADEIQLYRLKVIPYGDQIGTITKKYANERDAFVSVEQTIIMKQLAISILAENGYQENLRRVFTRQRKHFSHYAHNQCCNLFDQIGIGLTAFSSLRDRFVLNTQSFEEYYSAIEKGRLPLNRGLVRDQDQQIRWNIILPLKNRNVRKKLFQERTGLPLEQVHRNKIERLKEYDLAYETEKKLEFTERGAFFADEAAELFYHPDFMPFPATNYAPGALNPYGAS